MGVAVGVAVGVAEDVAMGVAAGVAWGVAWVVALGVAVGVAGGVAAGVAWGVGTLRIPDFTLGSAATILLVILQVHRPDRSRALARYLPHRHHDLLYLPTPGLGRFLEVAGREDAALGEGLIAEAASSLGQKRPARRALLALRAWTLEEIARSGELERLPGESVPFLRAMESAEQADGRAFPFALFRDSASDLVAAREHPIHAEARKSIERARHRLQEWREARTEAASTTLSRRLLPVVGVWLEAVEREAAALSERERLAPQVPNVFHAGARLEPGGHERDHAVFKGRRDIGRQIARDLAGDRTAPIFVFGQRRMGKSSFLAHLPRMLGTGTRIVPVDFQALSGREDRGRPWSWIAERVARAVPKCGEPPPETGTWGTTLEWLGELDGRLAEEDRRLLVAIDEVEALERGIRDGWAGPDLLDFVRAAGDRLQHVRMMLLSAHELGSLGEHWTDRLISAVPRRVGYLDEDSARELIERPVEGFPAIYPPGGVDRILEATNRQPYLIQVACSNLCDLLNDPERPEETRRSASPADVEAALDRAVQDNNVFAQLWAQRDPVERGLLRRLVDGEVAVSVEQLPDPEREAARRLVREEYLIELEGRLRFAVPLWLRWVRLNT